MATKLTPHRRLTDAPPTTSRAPLHPSEIPGPPLARWLFKDTRAAWFWLPLRLYLGWSWLEHGLQKVTNPAWTESGEALAGFWQNAVTIDPKPVITVGWKITGWIGLDRWLLPLLGTPWRPGALFTGRYRHAAAQVHTDRPSPLRVI